jgi:hypothetical protein
VALSLRTISTTNRGRKPLNTRLKRIPPPYACCCGKRRYIGIIGDKYGCPKLKGHAPIDLFGRWQQATRVATFSAGGTMTTEPMTGSSLPQQAGARRLCSRRRISKTGPRNQQFRQASAIAQSATGQSRMPTTVEPRNARANEPSRSLSLFLGICAVYILTVFSVAAYHSLHI